VRKYKAAVSDEPIATKMQNLLSTRDRNDASGIPTDIATEVFDEECADIPGEVADILENAEEEETNIAETETVLERDADEEAHIAETTARPDILENAEEEETNIAETETVLEREADEEVTVAETTPRADILENAEEEVNIAETTPRQENLETEAAEEVDIAKSTPPPDVERSEVTTSAVEESITTETPPSSAASKPSREKSSDNLSSLGHEEERGRPTMLGFAFDAKSNASLGDGHTPSLSSTALPRSDDERRRKDLIDDGWLSDTDEKESFGNFLDNMLVTDAEKAIPEDAENQLWREYEDSWFSKNTYEHFYFSAHEATRTEAGVDEGPPLPLPHGPQLERLLQRAGINEVGENTRLGELDSLRMQNLASWIKDDLGIVVSAANVLQCTTARELCDLVAEAPREQAQSSTAPVETEDNKLYRIWFSPGQFQLMGSWCLRKEGKIDYDKLVQAAEMLINRHEALRVRKAFPTRVLSFVLDTAVLFQLSAPIYPWLRVLAPWFKAAWPVCEVVRNYKELYPDNLVHRESSWRCQVDLERGMRERRFAKWNGENIEISLVELNMHLEGTWVSNDKHVVVLFPCHKESNRLVFAGYGWIGKLYTHCDVQWRKSPDGCPALYVLMSVEEDKPLLWVRVDRENKLIIYTPGYRKAHRKPFYRITSEKSVSTVSTIHMRLNHAFGDAMSYYPLVHDLLTFYRSLVEGKKAKLTDPGPTMLKLQNRLFEAFDLAGGGVTEDRSRYSMRGSLFKHRGTGYSYDFILKEDATRAMLWISRKYGIPPEVLLLGIVACGVARAGRTESCDFTMYAPCRDGHADQQGIGLFADWRDLTVNTPEDCTIIGVIWDVHEKIRRREWTIFNCARKPDRAYVNFQLNDSWKRGSRDGFQQLHEDSWKHGETEWKFDEERKDCHVMNQPMSFNIEQESEYAWWISCSLDYYQYRPAYCRRMLQTFRNAFYYLVHDPAHRLHE